MNEFTENECVPNFELNFKFFHSHWKLHWLYSGYQSPALSNDFFSFEREFLVNVNQMFPWQYWGFFSRCGWWNISLREDVGVPTLFAGFLQQVLVRLVSIPRIARSTKTSNVHRFIYYLLFIETSILSWKHLIDVRQKLTFKRGKIRLRARVIGNRCKRVSIVSALVRLTTIENVWFCSGGFSYAIQEKFTAWRRSESQVSVDFTGKTDIARMSCDAGFWREIQRGIHSSGTGIFL